MLPSYVAEHFRYITLRGIRHFLHPKAFHSQWDSTSLVPVSAGRRRGASVLRPVSSCVPLDLWRWTG